MTDILTTNVGPLWLWALAVVWAVCGWHVYINSRRENFWRWASIWDPTKRDNFHWMFALMGPIALLVYWLNGSLGYARVPKVAYEFFNWMLEHREEYPPMTYFSMASTLFEPYGSNDVWKRIGRGKGLDFPQEKTLVELLAEWEVSKSPMDRFMEEAWKQRMKEGGL